MGFFFPAVSRLISENVDEIPGLEAWIVEIGELQLTFFESC